MFKPYQDIDDWSRERLENELENLHKDKVSGSMTEDMYRECYDIILGQILRKEDEELVQDAYDRSMKGI